MPNVLRLPGGLRAVIYSNDRRPVHIHVIGGGREAVFDLHCPDGPPELRESYGFASRDVTAVVRALRKELTSLCDAWRRIHGTP